MKGGKEGGRKKWYHEAKFSSSILQGKHASALFFKINICHLLSMISNNVQHFVLVGISEWAQSLYLKSLCNWSADTVDDHLQCVVNLLFIWLCNSEWHTHLLFTVIEVHRKRFPFPEYVMLNVTLSVKELDF